ncbi:MAG: MetQ/NlpA family ABC transporter substrate-binding protein [Chloroflexi bacterium]|nr:MetQ/NlpA family ABC transporter substrate-binding protein [Chloroflexota bacterium]
MRNEKGVIELLRKTLRQLVMPAGLLALLVVVAGCSSAAKEPAPTAPADQQPTEVAVATPTKVRVGLLPIIDSVPFYAAEADGLFRDVGLDVELISFGSALERNVALEAGEIDGQLADLIATGLLNNDEHRVTIVKTLYRANDQRAMISLVAGKNSGISSPADLVGKDVAISHNSLIEYHLDQYLDAAGIARDAVSKVEVASIPIRMEMLSQGQVAAAVLPEPLTSLAIMGGGTVILEDKESRLGLSVLEFSTTFLEKNRDAVQRFVAAHEKAVRRINADSSTYQHLLPERARLPEVLIGSFGMPPFPEGAVPTEAEIAQSYVWLVEKQLVTEPRAYTVVVDASFVASSSGVDY